MNTDGRVYVIFYGVVAWAFFKLCHLPDAELMTARVIFVMVVLYSLLELLAGGRK